MGIETPEHLLFIGLIALVVLGPKRLPELARAAGKGLRELRAAMNGEGGSGPFAGGEQAARDEHAGRTGVGDQGGPVER